MRSAWKPGSVAISLAKLPSSWPPITIRTTDSATSATTSEERMRSRPPAAAPRVPKPSGAMDRVRASRSAGAIPNRMPLISPSARAKPKTAESGARGGQPGNARPAPPPAGSSTPPP